MRCFAPRRTGALRQIAVIRRAAYVMVADVSMLLLRRHMFELQRYHFLAMFPRRHKRPLPPYFVTARRSRMPQAEYASQPPRAVGEKGVSCLLQP